MRWPSGAARPPRTAARLALVGLLACPLATPPPATAQPGANARPAPPAPGSAPAAASAPAPADAAALDQTVARVLKTFDVPGVGLAIVKDGAVVVAKGYGVRKLGEPTPVDGRTVFAIASNTKAFAATALGLLVEEGKIEWDAPVITYVPWFQMWDPYVTRELTVRDLLVHRSGLGLGAGDLLWWPTSTYDRKEIARRLRFVPPATSFRSAYAYDNVLYLVAGEVIEAVSGQGFEEFISSRLLKPAGMTGSSPRLSDLKKAANVAAPHAPIEVSGQVSGERSGERSGEGSSQGPGDAAGRLTVRPIATFDSDNTNPAGGISASAEDMAKWMLVQLAEGRLPDGTRLFSERTARELTTLVTPMPNAEPPPELSALRANFRGYGLGFNVHDYRGRKVVTHTGGLPGYVSKLTLLPELELGVMVLTNQESGEAFSALTWQIVDGYLGNAGPRTGAASAAGTSPAAVDWVDAYAKLRARREAGTAETEKKAAAARDASSRPSLPLARYAGAYADAWYGNIEIAHDSAQRGANNAGSAGRVGSAGRDVSGRGPGGNAGGSAGTAAAASRLTMTFSHTPSLVGDLEHWQHDTFIVRWRDRELRADAYVTFALDPDGRVAEARMRAVSPATDFSFDFHDLTLRPVRTAAAPAPRD